MTLLIHVLVVDYGKETALYARVIYVYFSCNFYIIRVVVDYYIPSNQNAIKKKCYRKSKEQCRMDDREIQKTLGQDTK